MIWDVPTLVIVPIRCLDVLPWSVVSEANSKHFRAEAAVRRRSILLAEANT